MTSKEKEKKKHTHIEAKYVFCLLKIRIILERTNWNQT